ncbi:MAG: histidine--tRNA ligase [Elusimicrobiota bacterium]|nr:histidine--tRNA ligase [Elusimicrobiota bacterium]
MKYKKIRGTYDILPEKVSLYRLIEETSRQVFYKYQYKELRIPTFEILDLFIHSTGSTTDIVQKEMYVFDDKKGRKLALRPEGTPGVVRAYIENQLQLKYPVSKFCYFGQMFRYERPQETRRREFYQIGCEYFGNAHPVADAEVIIVLKEILNSVGITDINIKLNSLGCINCRNEYRQVLLKFLDKHKRQLCEDCNKRLRKNPLRCLDCKVDASKLTTFGVPTIDKFLCDECLKHFKLLEELLKEQKVDYSFTPLLVRGLDYYTKTVFEVTAVCGRGGESDVIAAGGRYDNLVKDLQGEDTPAVGFAIGTDRTVELLSEVSKDKIATLTPVIFVAVQPQEVPIREAFKVASKLHSENISAVGPYPDRSLKSQMRLANSINSEYVVIIAENELKNGSCILRNMMEKSQIEIKISELYEKLKCQRATNKEHSLAY